MITEHKCSFVDLFYCSTEQLLHIHGRPNDLHNFIGRYSITMRARLEHCKPIPPHVPSYNPSAKGSSTVSL